MSETDFNDLLVAQMRALETEGIKFNEEMEKRNAQYRAAIDAKLNSPTPVNPDVAEIISLINSVPKIAPAVLKYTKETLQRIQAAVDAELNK